MTGKNSSSSTATPKSKSSSSPTNAAQQVMNSPNIPPISGMGQSWLTQNAAWIVPTLLTILSAVIFGYFTHLMQLKDEIALNRKDISLAQKDIEYLKDEDKKNETNTNDINKLKTDIAILQSKSNLNSKTK